MQKLHITHAFSRLAEELRWSYVPAMKRRQDRPTSMTKDN